MSDAAGGTVFDIGYRSYAGAREGRGRAVRAIFDDGVRIALGLGRGGRAKILPWFFIVVLSAIGLVMAIVAGAAARMMGPEAAQRADLTLHNDYYGIASIILFVFAAVVAPELLCRDRREGTIQLYLVRPVTATDYVLARWAAMVAVMLAAAWLPQVVLLLGHAAGAAAPGAYLRAHWLDVPRFLAAGLVMVTYVTTLAMLTASFTTRRAYAAIFLVGLVAISAPFTVGLASELGSPVGPWISMFTLTNIPVHVNDVIFQEVSELTEDAPARELSDRVRVAWWLLWTAGPGVLLWWRYRRLTP
ncbi:MAG TPA: ABC transporter permease subunit [Gemmatimonadaceae bacterium]